MHGDYKVIADYIACELRLQARGDIHRSHTWIDAGDRMGCLMMVHDCASAPPGQYRTSGPGGTGVITFYGQLSEQQRCLVLVHELAHHVLMRQSTDSLFDYVRCYNYNGASDARDDIARRVESIIFPGIRRSSKVRRFQGGRAL